MKAGPAPAAVLHGHGELDRAIVAGLACTFGQDGIEWIPVPLSDRGAVLRSLAAASLVIVTPGSWNDADVVAIVGWAVARRIHVVAVTAHESSAPPDPLVAALADTAAAHVELPDNGEAVARGVAEIGAAARHFLDRGSIAPPGGTDTLVRALARELDAVYLSPTWRAGRRCQNAAAALRSAWRRTTRPLETARIVAPRLLPLRLRIRLSRLFQSTRSAVAQPAAGFDTTVPAAVATDRPARPTVIWLSAIDWTFRTQRPQHLTRHVAALGWPVWYSGLPGTPPPRDGQGSLPHPAPGVSLLDLAGARPLDAYRDPLRPDDVACMADRIGQLAAAAGVGCALVLCELPFWRPLAERLRASFGWPIVCDLTDDHTASATHSASIVGEADALLASADLVTASAAPLLARARAAGAPVSWIPNACDPDHWAAAGAPTGGDRERAAPIIGYFGAIAESFDCGLVAWLARERPAWTFVLVGAASTPAARALADLANVKLAGEHPYDALPALVAGFRVGIVPFLATRSTEATDPVNVYEMAAAGLPVVATRFGTLESIPGLISVADDRAAFLAALDDEVRRPPSPGAAARRKAWAHEHSWSRRAEALVRACSAALPTVSIGIVTFNNVALTRACLASLLHETVYPSLDVIVVDNGSTDGTAAWLQDLARETPEIRLVLNKENRGFAVASNQAIAVARGSYFCFLNNDTILTRDWLHPLVRSLASDPRIGLVGPVTNAVTNEARVEVGYNSLKDLQAWATGWTRAHRGQQFEVPMLGLFCALTRRDTLERVGVLDERFEVGMFEDDDWCRRLREAGWSLACRRDSFVHHWQGASFALFDGTEFERIYTENRRRFHEKWRRRDRSP